MAIKQGRKRGFLRGSVLRFESIPYASGERFAPPSPAVPFQFFFGDPSTTTHRQSLSITCPVDAPPSIIESDFHPRANAGTGSTPTDGTSPGAPVIVFIHGGRYEEGFADELWYQGVRFAEEGFVYVSLNYRYRFEGFLPLVDEQRPADIDPSIDPNKEPEYYRGAEDIVVALQWVRDNIAAFGGDPEQVTLMGQSAGGALTLSLIHI